MDRLRRLFNSEQAYEPLDSSVASVEQVPKGKVLSWLDYSSFLLLGTGKSQTC